ncbi:glycosyltransferase family 87 protein [Limnoglobus roseus]|uniref:DUF2029 domain-containing protein n=1 Tax=Limnoglobus roseus TaxID=2598579 RepID=A0A5C1AR05_9BACT|nr:glycosyltransferase family 87 protein [Limnoglobus roseus]QEL19634.1 hypothetical protein PX52LOC_06710 [Limnoglobus roseus]
MRTVVLIPLLLTALAVAVLLGSPAFPRGAVHRVEDFGLYWSAARVNLSGGNPYDPHALWPYQQAIEPDRAGPQLPWGPPWSLGLLTPFAAADFPAARWAWLLVGIALLVASSTAVWAVYGGPPDRATWAWLLAVTFYPSLLATALGQQTVFALAGVAGFLWSSGRGRPALAGACLALVLAKPQNLILLGAAVIAVARFGRQWRLLGGLLAGCAALSMAALIPNPGVFDQYAYALTHYPPRGWPTPTLGTYLRLGFGVPGIWPAFLVTAAGLVWVGWYWAAHRNDWDWRDRLPVVLFASHFTTPYGWAYDQVVLVIPLLQAAAAVERRGASSRTGFLVCHAALTLTCVVLNRLKTPEYTFVWLAPVLFLGWAIVRPGSGRIDEQAATTTGHRRA